jgi:hypothetical protein
MSETETAHDPLEAIPLAEFSKQFPSWSVSQLHHLKDRRGDELVEAGVLIRGAGKWRIHADAFREWLHKEKRPA